MDARPCLYVVSLVSTALDRGARANASSGQCKLPGWSRRVQNMRVADTDRQSVCSRNPTSWVGRADSLKYYNYFVMQGFSSMQT